METPGTSQRGFHPVVFSDTTPRKPLANTGGYIIASPTWVMRRKRQHESVNGVYNRSMDSFAPLGCPGSLGVTSA